MSKISDLSDLIESIRAQASAWPHLRGELDYLRSVHDWAVRSLALGFKEGEQVRIRPGFAIDREKQRGWWHFREALAPGATAVVQRIRYAPHSRRWIAEIVLDREWEVSEFSDGSPTVRYWRGPAVDTPPGYRKPSAFDQEKYPDGKRSRFALLADEVEPAGGGQTGGRRWTTHGYWIGSGTQPKPGTAADEPSLRARCGGPGLCRECAVQAAAGGGGA